MNYQLCGALNSPIDDRDYVAEDEYMQLKKLKIPPRLSYRKYLQPVRSQHGQGSCVAQTIAAIKEYQEKKDVKFNQYFSPQFIYNQRSNYPRAGMYGRDAMKIIQKMGICRESIYPYGTIEKAEDIPSYAKEEARNYTIKSYARVHTMKGLLESLYLNGPCYISFPVYNYTPRFWIQRDTDEYIGGHAVTVIGYNKKGFILRNSWGADWGDNGYTIYPYYDWRAHKEIWTTIDDKSKYIKYNDKKCCNIF